MAQTVKETVQVTGLGKWGPKVGDEYYSWSKQIKDADKGKVVPGGTYNMELYIADSGKRYINSVESDGNVLAKPVAPLVAKESLTGQVAMLQNTRTKDNPFKKSEEMTRADWDAKDRRISRQGCIQVAVQVTQNFDEAVELAEKMLGFVNG